MKKSNMQINIISIIRKLSIVVIAYVFSLLFSFNVYAGGAYAKILNSTTVQYCASLSATPASDDGLLYLYELKTYEDSISPAAIPIAYTPIDSNVSFNFDLNHKQINTRLYSKFVLATKVGGVPVMINMPQYITNPEKLATNTRNRIKIDKALQNNSITNLVLTGNGLNPLANNPVVVLLARNGSTVTHPMCNTADSAPISYQYCMFNAANEAGVNGLVYDLTPQAASSKGQDFIVGNEVHERTWNYMAYTDWTTYVREYARAFRVCYNVIKSENANAKVYISLGQNWNRDFAPSHPEYTHFMDAKDFVDVFNAEITAGGNIDWSIAIHPYTCPLTYAKFWDMNSMTTDASYNAYHYNQVASNKMITFQNLSVETNYLANFKNPNGNVRTMFISEIGLSNTSGDQVQAAAIAASWVAYKRNPYISGYMYLSNIGDGVDSRLIGQGLNMYNALGTANEAAMLEWAKAYIGITDWNQILR